ncbi:MAG: SRPBCC family protein [Armatimonadetes bacterium]|nr:SRPBCC family protein [Armatimonadota bacterium]
MEWKKATSAIGAAAAGAATAYLLDPDQGRRRRALVRDKVVHTGHVVGDSSGVVARDLVHRVRGLLAQRRSWLLRGQHVPPRRMEERARSVMGRIVSHPGAIDFDASDGTLVVSGYILKREVEPLLKALHELPGVKQVENRLEVGRHPERMPSLQGGRRREGVVPDLFQRRMAPTTRLLLGAGAVSLMSYGLRRRNALGWVWSSLGMLGIARAGFNVEWRRLLGFGGREAVRLQNTIEVAAPVHEVFEFFSHFENFPRFMQHIRRVRPGEHGIWHWEADGPLGTTVSWDGVVTRMEPDRRISWKSVPGSEVGNAGTVWFHDTGRGTTRVHIQMVYSPPAGAIGHAVAALLGADPIRQMDEDLVRFKSLIERGKTSAHGEQVTREEVEAAVV